MLFFTLAHIPLALAMYKINALTALHALFALGVGLYCALFESRRERVLYAAAYIVGSEVMWRMCHGTIPWEFGKYAVILTLGAAIFRDRRPLPAPLLLYISLLLVGIVPTLVERGFSEQARQTISFNLSGMLALTVCAWYCNRLSLTGLQLQKLLFYLAAPLLGMAAITRYAVVENLAIIHFTTESNVATSGGFGPNQVATTLALGALAFFLVQIVQRRSHWSSSIFLLLGACFFLMQSTLTFSRSGLYNFVGALVVALFFLMRSKRARLQLLGLIVPVMLIGYYLVLPYLDALTGGKILTRFQSMDTSNRAAIMQGDLRVWQDNPIFGVGVGLSKSLHFREAVATHTEYSRMLAEHGSLGLMALLLLLFLCFYNVRRQVTPQSKAVAAGFITWSLLFMANSATRIAAPSFLLGLCFMRFLSDRTSSPPASPRKKQRRTSPLSGMQPESRAAMLREIRNRKRRRDPSQPL